MNDDIRPVLRDLVQREGAAVYDDPRRCEAMLRDLAGAHRGEISVLITVQRAGAVTELLGSSAGLREVTVARVAVRMAEEYGLDREASRWAVEVWADALNLARPAPAPAPPPVAPVDDDYTRTAGSAGAAGAAGAVGGAAGAAAGVGWAATSGPPSGPAPAGPPSGPGGWPGGPPAGPPSGPGGWPGGPPPGPPSGPPPGGPPTGPPRAGSPGPGFPPAGPPGAFGPGGYPQPEPSRRRKKGLLPYIALAAAVVLIGTAVYVVTTAKKASAGEVFAEPASSTGANPFTQSVANLPTGTLPALPPIPQLTLPTLPSSPSLPTVPTTQGSGPAVVTSVSGGQPGLYGGTRDSTVCDAAKMLTFLDQNPAKAAAWAAAEGIPVSGIADFLGGLTPVLLRADTRVTNHGFSNGRATPLQSILQAGTAVLVDRYGVPRAKCACGNPLKPAVAVRSRVHYGGTKWPGFSPSQVVVVTPPPTIINIFVLVDVHTGQTFQQPPGVPGVGHATPPGPTPSTTGLTVPPNLNLGAGDVQVTLLWQGGDDLDLHVTDPAGEEIYFQHRISTSGGRLDHDDTAGCNTDTGTHAENIFWPVGGAPPGGYSAFVDDFSNCGSAQAFELRVTVNGRIVSDNTGSLSTEGSKSTAVSFRH